MKPGGQGCGRGKAFISREHGEELGPGKHPEKQEVKEEMEKPPENRAYVWAVDSEAQALPPTSSVILGTSFIPLHSVNRGSKNPLLLGLVQGLNAHMHLYDAPGVEDIPNTGAVSSGKELTRCRCQRDGGAREVQKEPTLSTP